MAKKELPTDLVDLSGNLRVKVLTDEENRVTNEIQRLQDYLEQVRDELKDLMDGHQGLRCGDYVAAYEPVQRWRTQELRNRYPNLTNQFVREVTKSEFQMDLFRKAFPEKADEFQVRSWRVIGR